MLHFTPQNVNKCLIEITIMLHFTPQNVNKFLNTKMFAGPVACLEHADTRKPLDAS